MSLDVLVESLDQERGGILVHVGVFWHVVPPRLAGVATLRVGGSLGVILMLIEAGPLLDCQGVEQPGVLILGVQLGRPSVYQRLLRFPCVQHRLLCFPCGANQIRSFSLRLPYYNWQSSNRTCSGSRQTRRFQDLSYISTACNRCGSASVAA
jgi:hypothetical protein